MILDEIVSHKKKELAVKNLSIMDLSGRIKALPAPRNFLQAIFPRPTSGQVTSHRARDSFSLIAEVKKFSPSTRQFREGFNPLEIAHIYEEAGADALSVLTDEKYFGGSPEILASIKKEVCLPVLAKDFFISEAQVYEARAYGADAILLIVRLLNKIELSRFLAISRELGMHCLVEIHNEEDLRKIAGMNIKILGINNRDLDTLQVHLQTSISLMEKIRAGEFFPARAGPEAFVSESGIESLQDIKLLVRAGINAVLVGSSLLRAPDIKIKFDELKKGK